MSNIDHASFCQSCGQSLGSALRVQNIGTLISSYTIISLLGYGGFGAVYEAENYQKPGDRFALKEAFDPASIHSFRKEFATLSKLSHPNLPHYYDIFESNSKGYLVMELVPGQNLEDMIQQHGPISEMLVCDYATQLCDALTYLHQQTPAIIHRDIKPANIRITPSNVIKLVDFGLHKQGIQQTQTSIRGMGTPAYAPVEQYGSGTEIRSDIYSLGATLYHLLTGQEPPVAPTRLSASKDTLVAPHQINPQVSRAMSGAIVKAMGIRPSERFESTAAFRRTLRSISTSSKPRRSRTNLAIFAAILLFLCPVMFILAGSLISLTESLPQQTTGDSYRALSDNTPAPTTVPGNKSVTSSPIRASLK